MSMHAFDERVRSQAGPIVAARTGTDTPQIIDIVRGSRSAAADVPLVLVEHDPVTGTVARLAPAPIACAPPDQLDRELDREVAGALVDLLLDSLGDELTAVAVLVVRRPPEPAQRDRGTRQRRHIHAVPSGTTARPPLAEPLTRRELEVLRYLPTCMPNAEIARKLYVSTNTVKTHVQHIYQKFGASDRTDAVRLACEYGLC